MRYAWYKYIIFWWLYSGSKGEEAAEDNCVCHKWSSNIYFAGITNHLSTGFSTFILVESFNRFNLISPTQAASMVTITFLMSPVIEELFGENFELKYRILNCNRGAFWWEFKLDACCDLGWFKFFRITKVVGIGRTPHVGKNVVSFGWHHEYEDARFLLKASNQLCLPFVKLDWVYFEPTSSLLSIPGNLYLYLYLYLYLHLYLYL